MADIFISYSSQDKSVVRHLAGLLENRGWSVWWDRQIPIGQAYDTVIEQELNQAKCVLVVWTAKSIASEWVKNEANEAAGSGKLVPIILEHVELPLAFKRIESAMLIGWQGATDHPELELVYQSIQSKMDGWKAGHPNLVSDNNLKVDYKFPKYFAIKHKVNWVMGIGLLFVILFVLYYQWSSSLHRMDDVIVRVFDWNRNPVVQGTVKMYLDDFIRTQSVDIMGQAFFNDVPMDKLKSKLKIEIVCPGYQSKSIDTVLSNHDVMEFSLPFTTTVFISGRVKTADEHPIKNVEVNVDGTRYVGMSITDGSYLIRLEEYTMGDEITITTSHEEYEDKTFAVRISAPEIKNLDIFLNPVSKTN